MIFYVENSGYRSLLESAAKKKFCTKFLIAAIRLCPWTFQRRQLMWKMICTNLQMYSRKLTYHKTRKNKFYFPSYYLKLKRSKKRIILHTNVKTNPKIQQYWHNKNRSPDIRLHWGYWGIMHHGKFVSLPWNILINYLFSNFKKYPNAKHFY